MAFLFLRIFPESFILGINNSASELRPLFYSNELLEFGCHASLGNACDSLLFYV